MVDKDFQSLLGGIERDSNGQITSAAALELKIIGHMNGTAAKLQTIKADSALGEYVSALPKMELFSTSYYHLLKADWSFAFPLTLKQNSFFFLVKKVNFGVNTLRLFVNTCIS